MNDSDSIYRDSIENAIKALEYAESNSDRVTDVIAVAQVYALLAIAEALTNNKEEEKE